MEQNAVGRGRENDWKETALHQNNPVSHESIQYCFINLCSFISKEMCSSEGQDDISISFSYIGKNWKNW